MFPVVFGLCVLAAARGISEEEFNSLPRLYDLDDYESCLAPRSGLYCLGSFLIAEQDSSVYRLVKEYSQEPLHFNYTYLHRGYCVSSRCPQTSEHNVTLRRRFDACAQQFAQSRGLKLHLQKVHYCKTHDDVNVKRSFNVDIPQMVFLVVVGVLLVLNVAGTAYDLLISDDVKKNQLLTSWSLRVNWRRLTSQREHADPRLAAMRPLQGVRVVVLGTVIWTHAGFVQHILYAHSPRALEHMMSSWLMMIVKNGTALVQVFITISSFLLGYNLLLFAKCELKVLPKLLLLRYIRLAPVHLLVVGFAATWWGQLRDGPMWPAVTAEAASCRRKFWTQALYVNNVVRPEDQCLVQTWSLAVDMQLYVVAVLLTLGLHRWRHRAVLILSTLFVVSSLLNGVLAYVYHWKTMLYIMTPENLRTMFLDEPSFWWFYTSPWGSLPSCLLGLLLAHFHYNLQEQNVQPKDSKLLRWLFRVYFPLGLAWVFSGVWLQAYDSRLITAVHAAFERPVFTALATVAIFGLCNGFEGVDRDLFCWWGWRTLGRLSLPALMLHWCVNMLLAAARPQPLPTSPFDLVSDFVSTWVLTYLLAIPVSLLVELPVQRSANTLLS
ncbi:O-acyltransferase like protein-like [Plodia interpunctella]|uniref:O-acyltransferase like protein-like n=1 Tax=Plodia interpunctella TaxID=58824 RepID=UPI0023680E39|nr:O-acyltransferase like protein-like [Plodia interpunctella]